jgi:hypothetical protein
MFKKIDGGSQCVVIHEILEIAFEFRLRRKFFDFGCH